MLTIVYLRSGGMLLSKRAYRDWREVQDQFFDYMTSLGPYDLDDLFSLIQDEYADDPPFLREEVTAFVQSDAELLGGRVPT